MEIYNYSRITKQYLSTSQARPDPEELKLAQQKAGEIAATAVIQAKGQSKQDFVAAQATAYAKAANAVQPTVFLIPANATPIAPPIIAPGQMLSFNGQGWNAVVQAKPKIEEPKPVLPIQLLRDKRNDLLQQSDKMMLTDRPMNEALREKWKSYRQALRDLPAHTADPINAIWPITPQ